MSASVGQRQKLNHPCAKVKIPHRDHGPPLQKIKLRQNDVEIIPLVTHVRSSQTANTSNMAELSTVLPNFPC